MTNAIVSNIQCQVPQEEIALLCACLPSLIQQILCKSPWLTPNDIVQWLTIDILVTSSHETLLEVAFEFMC